MSDLLFGELALVTGSARGLGRAIATSYLEHGARVVLFDANPEVDNWRITIASSEVPVYVATLPTRHLPLISAGKWGGVALFITLLVLCLSLIWPSARARKREISDSFD